MARILGGGPHTFYKRCRTCGQYQDAQNDGAICQNPAARGTFHNWRFVPTDLHRPYISPEVELAQHLEAAVYAMRTGNSLEDAHNTCRSALGSPTTFWRHLAGIVLREVNASEGPVR